MVDEEAEGTPAQNPAAHFSGNIMNFERPKFSARQENRLEALKAFQKKSVDISSKEASLTYLKKESVYWYKIGSDGKARRFMTV